MDIVSVKSDDDIRAESVYVDASDRQYQRIAESCYLRLYFNKKTTAIIIKDLAGNKKWYSLPNGSNGDMVNMTVSASDGNHILNSQSNSVDFFSFEYKISSDGVNVRYILADDYATAKKKKFMKTDIAFAVTVDYTLKDGNFFVNSKIENLSNNPNCAVTDFSVLQYFGAFENPEKEDFLLIPDGCGAVAFPCFESGEKEYSCKVYGNDYAVENEGTGTSFMGAFGMKHGDSAYAAIIDSNEENASIKAVSSHDGFSRVSAHFAVDASKKEGNTLYFKRNSSPSVAICYKFLSKGNATYSDIASACREQFIRNGTFSTSSIKNSDDVPVSLIITGADKDSRRKIKYEEYTTFRQAEDIISRIKSKGINNITVRYSGVFDDDSTNIISALGGKSGLKELAEYAKSQNVGLFLDLNTLTYEAIIKKFDFSAARSMNKMPFGITVKNDISGKEKLYHFRTSTNENRFIDSLIEKTESFGITGYCLNDAGSILTSDFSHSGADRSSRKLNVMSQISALSAVGGIISDTGNIYTVKGSSSVINIPMSVSYDEGEQYRKVPFIQSVFHGMTVLSSEAINTSENSREYILRCIEYGVCPSFSVVYKKPDACKKNILFDDTVNDIVSVYGNISEALDSLEGERITAHSQVKDGVFCTTYSNSTRIYVNYTEKNVTVSGIEVPANDYIRID